MMVSEDVDIKYLSQAYIQPFRYNDKHVKESLMLGFKFENCAGSSLVTYRFLTLVTRLLTYDLRVLCVHHA